VERADTRDSVGPGSGGVIGLDQLTADLGRVEDALRVAVSSDDPLLRDVTSHLVEAGGKRLRPRLTLSAAYAATSAGAGAPASPEAVTGAAAVELVHLGSLYHDDVIDEAETRRGVPSVNARWSNIVAILAGDYLLAAASERAASLGADVAMLLASTIGELCRGQVLELQHLFDAGRSEAAYFAAISGKTAALFATACRIGGMVSDVSAATLTALTDFGEHLGMCFQIVDDVLDLTGTEEQLGKPAGNDLLEGVYTLPVIYALEHSTELRDRIGQPLDPTALHDVRTLVGADGAVTAALDVARSEAKLADEALANAGDELDVTVCASLRRLVEGLITRQT
jgi:geranylgeranyl pyrophosphate synthase